MKVKALINLSYKNVSYKIGDVFDMTSEDYQSIKDKKYVQSEQFAKKKVEEIKEEIKEGVEDNG